MRRYSFLISTDLIDKYIRVKLYYNSLKDVAKYCNNFNKRFKLLFTKPFIKLRPNLKNALNRVNRLFFTNIFYYFR